MSEPTSRTRITREPQLAIYDREAAYGILDEAFVCHVGFTLDGQPYVIPTSFGRKDDYLYIHGSAASRMLRNMKQAVPVCITITLVDGLVLARSVFNHSMNYRSVVILGTAEAIEEREEKLAALKIISDHVIPGRWEDARYPNERELKATLVMRIAIEEFSAKVRTGPPIDDEDDYSYPTWAGVIPLESIARQPMPDPRLDPPREMPAYASSYKRRQ